MMEAKLADSGMPVKSLSSSKLMDIDTSSDEEKLAGSGASEDGEIEENEMEAVEATPTSKASDTKRMALDAQAMSDAQATSDAQAASKSQATPDRAEMDAVISADIAAGGQEVAQKDARYFMLADVVCSHCGVKGHLSFDCPEEEQVKNCYICGKSGHQSRECPDEMKCYYCGKSGHRARDCPERASGGRGMRRNRVLRNVSPPREPKLKCYVCGADGHLDCSLAKMTAGVLSCYNCGMKGHAGGGCNMTSADRVIPIVMEMERERKQRKTDARNAKKGGKDGEGKTVNGEEGEKDGANGNGGSVADSARAYREQILERARKSRYGRGKQ